VSGTDLKISVRSTAEAEVIGNPQSVAIPPGALVERLRALKGATVTLSVSASTLTVRAEGKREFRVPILDGADFPGMPVAGQEATAITLPAATISRLLGRVRHAASTDESRPSINSVQVAIRARRLSATATDGHRLAVESVSLDSDCADFEAVLPLRGVAALMKLSGDLRATIDKERVIVASGDGVDIAISQSRDPFPPVSAVIPKSTSGVAVVALAAVSNSVRAVAVASPTSTRAISLSFFGSALDFVSSAADLGEASDSVPIDFSGPAAKLSCNARYLTDALASLEEEGENGRLSIGVSGGLDPIVVRREGAPADCVRVIMPMRA
jgi:DNA polymerase-3 subunit beta